MVTSKIEVRASPHLVTENVWTCGINGTSAECASLPSLPMTPERLDTSAWMHAAAPYATTWAYSKSGKIDSITNLIADAAPFEADAGNVVWACR